MTVYFFHHWDGDAFSEDPDGVACVSLEAARERAIEGARDILSGDVKDGRINFNQRVELIDDAGRLCLTAPFRDAVEVFAPSMVEARSTIARTAGAR